MDLVADAVESSMKAAVEELQSLPDYASQGEAMN